MKITRRMLLASAPVALGVAATTAMASDDPLLALIAEKQQLWALAASDVPDEIAVAAIARFHELDTNLPKATTRAGAIAAIEEARREVDRIWTGDDSSDPEAVHLRGLLDAALAWMRAA